MSPIGECGYRRRDSGFRRNGNSFNFAAYLFSISPLSIPAPSFPFPPNIPIPAKAGISLCMGQDGLCTACTDSFSMRCGRCPHTESGDSRFRGNGRGGVNGSMGVGTVIIKRTSIPAKAGISFSRQREFSAKRNIAMFAFRRMRLSPQRFRLSPEWKFF